MSRTAQASRRRISLEGPQENNMLERGEHLPRKNPVAGP